MDGPLAVRVQDQKTDFVLEAHGFDHWLDPRPLHSYLLKRKMLSFSFIHVIHSAMGKQPGLKLFSALEFIISIQRNEQNRS